MSVSHFLVPANSETGKIQNLSEIIGTRMPSGYADFSTVSLMIILFPEKVLPYFGKDKEYYDFIFAFTKFEFSEKIFEPSEIRSKLIEISNILRTKEGFPLGNYYYFQYEDTKLLTFLYVTLKGSELNKIVKDKIYEESEPYDISFNFDEHNQCSLLEVTRVINVRDKNGKGANVIMDISCFPATIEIIKVERDYGFGKEIKKVHLTFKKPFEHFKEELDRIIRVCDICIEHRLGLKAHVDY
ncbi:MAG: hypothetical protein JNL02_06400 [Saprospiraceae bacterium]|nr:hypothetical protein [Saprospiraceae bacterium]